MSSEINKVMFNKSLNIFFVRTFSKCGSHKMYRMRQQNHERAGLPESNFLGRVHAQRQSDSPPPYLSKRKWLSSNIKNRYFRQVSVYPGTCTSCISRSM